MVSDAKVAAVSSLLNLCERATISLTESLSNAVKAAIIVNLKYVDKVSLFQSILPDTFIDWEYVKNVGGISGSYSSSVVGVNDKPSVLYPMSSFASSGGNGGGGTGSFAALSSLAYLSAKKNNMLGDSGTWLQLMQFVDFGDLQIPERILQRQYPPLFCMYAATSSQMHGVAEGSRLNFSDACKLLLLNNVEGLTSRNILELHTSSRMGQNTYVLCSNIIGALADERHSSAVYEETFKYIMSTGVIKINEEMLAQYISHYRQSAAARKKVWELKHIQNKTCRPSMRKVCFVAACSFIVLYTGTDLKDLIVTDSISLVAVCACGSIFLLCSTCSNPNG